MYGKHLHPKRLFVYLCCLYALKSENRLHINAACFHSDINSSRSHVYKWAHQNVKKKELSD